MIELVVFFTNIYEIPNQDNPTCGYDECLILCKNNKYSDSEPEFILYHYKGDPLIEPKKIAYFDDWSMAVKISDLYLETLNKK